MLLCRAAGNFQLQVRLIGVGQTNTLGMRLTLPVAVITIIIYEIILIALGTQRMIAQTRAVATNRQGDWIVGVAVPVWLWVLVIIPPVVLIGYWAFRRSRS